MTDSLHKSGYLKATLQYSAVFKFVFHIMQLNLLLSSNLNWYILNFTVTSKITTIQVASYP
jgi:hypothetical protein